MNPLLWMFLNGQRPQDFSNIQTFSSAGNFTFDVPDVPFLLVHAWGGGGGGSGPDGNGDWRGGGGGGFISGKIPVTAGHNLKVRVGPGGSFNPNDGGGFSGLASENGFISIGDVLIVAGGGGAAGGSNASISSGAGGIGGGGGVTALQGGGGQSSGGNGGLGGTQVAGGAGGSGNVRNGLPGAFLSGGDPRDPSTNGGGGGGGASGFYGGGSGGVDSQQSGGGGGGGGSSYTIGTALETSDADGESGQTNSRANPGEPLHADRPGLAGRGGGQSEGGSTGAVVIRW